MQQLLEDMNDAVEEISSSTADIWFPSVLHADLFGAIQSAFARFVTSETYTMARLNEVVVRDFTVMNPREIVAIRLNSPVFEGWRGCVEKSLGELARSLALGVDSDASERSARVILEEGAVALERDLQKEMREKWRGPLKGFVLGVLGTTPAIVEDGALLVASGAGAGASLLATVLWKLIDDAPNRRGITLLKRHTMTLGDAISHY
jgi:hypothetical protein